MKKITVFALALALASLVVYSPAQAEDSGSLEITGNVTTVTGWQRQTSGKYADPTSGVLGDGLVGAAGAGVESFGFFVDQVELDLAKSFGENIRARGDLDFYPIAGIGATPGRISPAAATGTADFIVEQGYVTANIPAGNGVEFLVGRFNSGIGLDPVDRGELSTVSFSSTHRVLLPHNLTGARAGYEFSDSFRWETYVVNDLADRAPAATTTIPSFGFNAIYNYGDEGNMSWFKFSGAGGLETPGLKKHWSFLGDMALHHMMNDAASLGLEGVYRQDNATAGAVDNNQFIAGTLKLGYDFSDVWDGTLRYGYLWDLDTGPAVGGTGVAVANNEYAPGLAGTLTNGGVRHDFVLATGYAIADGARFGLEGRFDLTKPSSGVTAGSTATGQNIGAAATFAYNF
ncbi:MAG: outer membrane beta-barrel protein [Deltaproteobacteria bacterium]|nr:outer membrane beta-barrel protein [Deltaproteobacteria bacterium]